MVYSGAWGKLIHEKTRIRKSRDTVPLIRIKEKHTENEIIPLALLAWLAFSEV
jgi:hypothetical protein